MIEKEVLCHKRKVAAVKIEKLKVLLLNVRTLVKLIRCSYTGSVQLTCHIHGDVTNS